MSAYPEFKAAMAADQPALALALALASVTDSDFSNFFYNSLSVTADHVTDSEFGNKCGNTTPAREHVTDTELSPSGVNPTAVTWKPSPDYARISVAMKYGDHCGKCGEPIGRFLPVVHGEARLNYSGILGSGIKYLKTVLCLKCAPPCYRKWNLGTCQVCLRVYYRKSQRAKHWFCCDRCEWRYRNQQARRRREQPDLRACVQCGRQFKARADSRTCSPACRQKAYRARIKRSCASTMEGAK